jgi:hypothetical protein
MTFDTTVELAKKAAAYAAKGRRDADHRAKVF